MGNLIYSYFTLLPFSYVRSFLEQRKDEAVPVLN